jgi:hypothetical protein
MYYALFHSMCRNCADSLIGTKSAQRSEQAWRQTYRAVSHGLAKSACTKNDVMKKFPKEIEDFANTFVTMQAKRHNADYDPKYRVARSEVLIDLKAVETAIRGLRSVPMKHRRAFAAWVALNSRNS